MIPPSRFEFALRGCLSGTRGGDFSARGERSSVRRDHFNVRRNHPSAPRNDSAAPENGGIEVRFRALVKQIKANASYNSAIGEALGIEGEEQAGPDLMTLQPEIKVMAGGSEVKVFWSWQGQRAFLDAIEIEVDHGTGWEMLTIPRHLSRRRSTRGAVE